MFARAIPRLAPGFILAMALSALALAGVGQITSTGQTSAPAQAAPAIPAIPTATPIPPCGPAWRTITTPNGNEDRNYLQAIAALSSNDIWAVGNYMSQASTNTLVEHWDGSTWNIIPSPNPLQTNLLNAISALGANDIWAVGTVTIHWDGNSWTSFPTPQSVNLHGVATVAPNDVWAVGGTIMHWDGSAWSMIAGAVSGELYAAAAARASDVWAVGTYWNGSAVATLIERWDGMHWSLVPSPNGQGFASQLSGITVVAANDVWAVGYSNSNMGLTTIIEHWDGSQWTLIPSPNHGSSGLNAIAARTSSDIWAVGDAEVMGGTYPPVLEHWDGSAWSLVAADNPTDFNSQTGVAFVGAGDVWVSGYRLNQQTPRTWSVHYSDPCTTTTPSPTRNPTRTSTPSVATPSATLTLAATATAISTATWTPTQLATPIRTSSPTAVSTDTPTAIATRTSTGTPMPTVCTMQFTDVPEGSPFYAYIHGLVCAGIISGYSDGTFRPNDNVTRGQAAKILANSAGYRDSISPDQETFEDVAPGSAFWLYIERIAVHGAISGYQCGREPAGPCVQPLNRPYFLPGNTLTRGQLAKIDAIAAGYDESIPATRQTFEDVDQNNTFRLYIERVYLHGAINGYQCGREPAGPCIAPSNRPYFLPGNNVTRGQTSKIVSRTFFPLREK
jgi:hypothetical protein